MALDRWRNEVRVKGARAGLRGSWDRATPQLRKYHPGGWKPYAEYLAHGKPREHPSSEGGGKIPRGIEIAPLKVVDFNFTEREPSVTLGTRAPSKRPASWRVIRHSHILAASHGRGGTYPRLVVRPHGYTHALICICTRRSTLYEASLARRTTDLPWHRSRIMAHYVA
ncbi:hypothetical protein KM043_005357 [Ampulex compressa]|nr:hypothetical protein KM043_005357 [Ampulex compressa]